MVGAVASGWRAAAHTASERQWKEGNEMAKTVTVKAANGTNGANGATDAKAKDTTPRDRRRTTAARRRGSPEPAPNAPLVNRPIAKRPPRPFPSLEDIVVSHSNNPLASA